MLQDFFETLETIRERTTGRLITTYRAMSPMLVKIEGLVMNTNSGKAPKLAHYYQFWERKIYAAIKQVLSPLTASVRE